MKISNLKINKRLLSLFLALGFSVYPFGTTKADSSNISSYSEEMENGFYLGYRENDNNLLLLNSQNLENLFGLKGVTLQNRCFYFSVGNREYNYYPESFMLSRGRNRVRFKIYASSFDNFDEITNIVTIVGGSGNRVSGLDLSGVSVSENSLVIVVYPGEDKSMVDIVGMIGECTRIVNHFVSRSGKNIHNSIIGISEGAQASFAVISRNRYLYQTFICCNGASYWTTNGINLIERFNNSGYRNFQNMEIIFFESKNNNNWNPFIIRTLEDLRNNGVDVSNISFYTNDDSLINGQTEPNVSGIYYPSVSSIIGDNKVYVLSEEESQMYGNWSSHGDGYKMIIDSNILSYITSDEHRLHYSNVLGDRGNNIQR